MIPMSFEPPRSFATPSGALPDEGIGALVVPALVLPAEAIAEELDRRFKADPELEGVVVARGGEASHLVPRDHFYTRTGGPFGFALFQKRPIELLGKMSPLVVDSGIGARDLAGLALGRSREDQYDPVIVRGAAGALGLITIRDLLRRVTELEIRFAQLLHPLTGLPGGRLVREWIEIGLENDTEHPLTVAFADLSGLQEYNGVYGLLAGDELVRRAAGVLSAACDRLDGDARLGHPGGDDFVLVTPRALPLEVLREICQRFDREKLALFSPVDRGRGWYEARDDRGNSVRIPLTSMVLAVVHSRSLGLERHPAIFAQLAVRMRRTSTALADALGRSCFVTSDPRDLGTEISA